MAQDIRKLLEEEHLKNSQKAMPNGHEARFLDKLETELPEKRKTSKFQFLKIAASVIILISLSYLAIDFGKDPIDPVKVTKTGTPKEEKTNQTRLGDLSPDLKKVEDYYLASINYELSKIELTPQNKDLFDGYLEQLDELNKEYESLTQELNDSGANEFTIDALIDNLKLRLKLLYQLKEQVKSFDDTEESNQERA